MVFLLFEVTESNEISITFDRKAWRKSSNDDFRRAFRKLSSCFLDHKKGSDSLLANVGLHLCGQIARDYLGPKKIISESSDRQRDKAYEILSSSLFAELENFFTGIKGKRINYNDLILRSPCSDFVGNFGKIGKKYSKKISNLSFKEGKDDQLWKMFFWYKNKDFYFQFGHILALCVWNYKVKKLWEKECVKIDREEKNHPAIIEPLYESVVGTLWIPSNDVIHTTGGPKLVDKCHNILAGIEPTDLESITDVRNRIGKLSTIQGQTFLRFAISEVQSRHFSSVETFQDPWTIGIEGGLKRLTFDILGFKKPSHIKDMHDVLNAGKMLNLRHIHKYIGGLWTYLYNEQKGRGRRGMVAITLGSAFRPHYQANERPILTPVTKIPPLVGRPNDYGKQAAFQWAIVGQIVKQRLFVAREGGAHLSESYIKRLGDWCGLSQNTTLKAWDRWLQDGSDGLKVFDRIAGDIFHLADNDDYKEPKAFIDETALRALQNSDRSKRHWKRIRAQS